METLKKHGREFSSDDEVSPRGILEILVSGTEFDNSGTSSSCRNSSSFFNSSSPEKSPSSSETKRVNVREWQGQPWKAMIDSWRKKSVQRISAISLLASSYEMSKKSLRKRRIERIRSAEDRINLGIIPKKLSWRNFDYCDL
ncbi:hypothetical protein QN277_012684 [Acacia crassicarpa]|uniref:Uncharacterized protein n=1 Tax=Acacia crassicarpa TaxID=499986 RepID=A0AAE1N1Z0_9FABA|nr:hypothetical protein QN277_012684 [Acacia crassicarpa]